MSFAPFVRASSAPWADVLLHYNDSTGVQAHADCTSCHAPHAVRGPEGQLAGSLAAGLPFVAAVAVLFAGDAEGAACAGSAERA